MIIPTGIKCIHMPDDKMLTIHPRSGLGTKYRFDLTNLTGIIDADYSDSKEKEVIFSSKCQTMVSMN